MKSRQIAVVACAAAATLLLVFGCRSSKPQGAPLRGSYVPPATFVFAPAATGSPGNALVLIDGGATAWAAVGGVGDASYVPEPASPGTAGQALTLLDSGATAWATVGSDSDASYSTTYTGAANSRPTATGSGALFIADDVPALYVDDRTLIAWKQYGTNGYRPSPGVIGGWTVVGTMGLAQYGDSILATNASATDSAVMLKPFAGTGISPTGAWAVTYAGRVNGSGTGVIEAGACVTNGTTGGTSTAWAMGRYTAPTGNAGALAAANMVIAGSVGWGAGVVDFQPGFGGGLDYMRLLSDGTDLYYQWSGEGFYWRTFTADTVALPTVSYYGAIVSSGGSGVPDETVGALIQQAQLSAPTQLTVTGATSGSTATITTSAAHNMATGFSVSLRGVTTSAGTAPNGIYDGTVIVTGSSTFTVPFSTSFTYTSGGVVTVTCL